MDLPPFFPYVRDKGGLFEDGGVIDNVPITFPANDGCDLIFILPLNADFEQAPNNTSIVARLFRVMEVRQGVLERNGFKMIYLYNELAALREHVDSLQALAAAPPRVNANRNSQPRESDSSAGANLHFLAASLAWRAKYQLGPGFSSSASMTLPEWSTITSTATLMRP